MSLMFEAETRVYLSNEDVPTVTRSFFVATKMHRSSQDVGRGVFRSQSVRDNVCNAGTLIHCTVPRSDTTPVFCLPSFFHLV